MIISAALRELMAAGVQGEALIAAVERIEAAQMPRTKGAIRTQRWRDKKASQSVTSDDVTIVRHGDEKPPLSLTSLPSESPSEVQQVEAGVNGRAPARSRGSRLPADWQPTADGAHFAGAELGDRAASELAKFKDYWAARAGAGGRKVDWDATWRTWIRRAAETRAPPGNGHQPRAYSVREQCTQDMKNALDKLDRFAKGGGGGEEVAGLLPSADVANRR